MTAVVVWFSTIATRCAQFGQTSPVCCRGGRRRLWGDTDRELCRL